MNGKLTFGAIALFVVLITFAGAASVRVQGATVGIQEGNYFTYKVNYASGLTNMLGVDNFTETVIGVSLVSGYHWVSYNELVYLSNGGNETNYGYTAIETSYTGTNSTAQRVFFSANLQVGDPIMQSSTMCVNETISVNGRPTNNASATVSSSYANITMTVKLDYCIDQATGVLVNEADSLVSNGQAASSESYTLIASNVWTVIPEFSPLAWAITMLVLSTSAAVIVSRKKAKQQFEKPAATLQHPKKRNSLTVERKHQTDNYKKEVGR
jgi:hypothetical protein